MNKLGSFITNGTVFPFYARKEIEINKAIDNAVIKICGLGQFILHINGKKVGDHELDPGWTDYNKVIEYVTFDIKDYLNSGRNAIAAEVGNGWFIKNDEHYTFSFPDFMPPNPNPYKPFGKCLVLALEITISYKDGTIEKIYADESFKVKANPVIQSNVYGSETFDLSLEAEGWDKAGFDDHNWEIAQKVSESDEPAGEFIEQINPPIKVIRTYPGEFLHHFNKSRDIYDFKQNMAGILSFRVKGHKGDEIRIYPAEKLTTDGDVDQVMKNWCLLDTVITVRIGTDDKWESVRQKFTYFAGRYIAIEKSDDKIEIEDIEADAITSAWKNTGSFSSDDERYNQIYQMIKKTVEANMVSVHTDCPTIERFAWQEPNHLMAPSIMFMKDGRKLWEKFLMDMRTSQHGENDSFHNYDGSEFKAGEGLVPSQAPCYIPNVIPVPGMGSFYDIIPWGSSAILGARWHYRFYGDKTVLSENYEMGMKYLFYLKTKINADGFINHGLGDWGNPDKELARENIETAFLYADLIAQREAAVILEKKKDADSLGKFAEEIRDNYNSKLLVQEDGHYFYRSFEHADENVMTQAVEALPLYFDIVPDYAREDVKRAFIKTLEEKRAFSSGEVGLPYIIQTARKCGRNDLIAEFITREEHPSYYAFVKAGMTTLGEYWEDNPRSHCHDMMGHIIEWYYNGIAGIEALEPGFKKVRINPWMPDSMNHFKCSYSTPHGKITVEGKRINGAAEFNIDIAGDIERVI
ncbi:MAG: glycoside hydrolase family 78 protein [Lachnospiraceae bacterium]|nr:glycoside hydrolase family 78 protein [Lachnospiraceae bacterium]